MPQIFASIGTNQARETNLKLAMDCLYETFGKLTISPVYQSQAVGFSGEDFFNLVVGFDSGESIETINQYFKQIEKLGGRDHSSPKFSDRTLDIDLLNYGYEVCDLPIRLPREEILHHAFVLQPLNDIAPDWIHPVALKSVKELWSRFSDSSQKLFHIPDPIEMSSYKS
ncbi:2-amino-4-hydroxy-6-hydroxymethyldihydropteridine diphosphokinase [Pleionea sediminis]|uniref:2-amino-4-hydroxy-6- hydroxymethyldihydropteridine diphosphokinase n=1 Tax=Pleionea sediminis TaxID=2569479 RepID=UPI001186E7AC|nr:2-amino-4-hydroxy-6-hydroxymethyldihydropteridine diphosphokinase [Pleionea sediminis]